MGTEARPNEMSQVLTRICNMARSPIDQKRHNKIMKQGQCKKCLCAEYVVPMWETREYCSCQHSRLDHMFEDKPEDSK